MNISDTTATPVASNLVSDIKALIESLTETMQGTNPLFLKASAGTLNRSQLISYLNMLFYSFQNTPVSLVYGLSAALETEDAALIGFIEDKITEERGHHRWPQADLEKLGVRADEYNPMLLGPEIIRLMEYAKVVNDEDPRLFLCYMYAFEYFSILVIPELLADLGAKCDLPSSGITALAYHQELDVEHSRQDEEIMETCLVDSRHTESAMRVAKRTMELLDASLREVTEDKPWARFH